ncbi:Retrovirus-related Pol polyprotein from transposon TNT 1-94-like protein [Drosera capensis]
MVQPKGFKAKCKEDMVCKLNKSLFGLKQAPRQCYLKFDRFMRKNGFTHCESDHCVYVKKFNGGDVLYLSLYVDDMLLACRSMEKINMVKRALATQFSMKDLGATKQILGMKIIRDRKERKLWLSHEEYIKKVLKRFNMEQAKPVMTPFTSHFKLSKEQS